MEGGALVAENWEVRKPAIRSATGLVAAQNTVAAGVGANVLAQGGKAVDAAVSTAFALGCCEPWMSGIGGGGYMVIYMAGEKTVSVVDFSMVAPKLLDPARYPLVGGTAPGFFSWPAVQDDRNLKGYESICVPGAVDGLGLALESFGRISFSDALQPAIALAEEGLPVDWYASHTITTSAAELAEFRASRNVFLPQGYPPVVDAPPLDQSALVETMRQLAKRGRRDFYEGELARSIIADLQSGGSVLTLDDLQDYRAQTVPPISLEYRGTDFYVPNGLCAGPTLVHTMQELSGSEINGLPSPGADAYARYAEALCSAYAGRFSDMGHGGSERRPNCTTHLSVIDEQGNMVALTNTLLAYFGSKVMLPGSGVLMNNAVMWFDPQPGGSNSIAPGVRPLTNMCPLIATRNDRGWFAAGASGGRHIVAAVAQLAWFIVDYGLDLEQAIHLPRIDVTGPDAVVCDTRLPKEVVSAIAKRVAVSSAPAGVYPVDFASPNAVMHDQKTGENVGATYPFSPWSGVVAAGR